MLISKFVPRLSVVGHQLSVSTIVVKDFEMKDENDEKSVQTHYSKAVKIRESPCLASANPLNPCSILRLRV
ncbi:MAG TPA: hypothetical protein PLL09_09860 [Flavobacterium sp.]|uniref:hypothetical protein n=1 Tax=unclassified Flavobacterium TaxID=196869 RepID=UPI0025BBFAFF|nr:MULTISPECIES: hypothetical protein [unclassified Flavobacterium]HRE78114.1 hypothetical protein [Flavobacterium sp.]